MHFPEVVAITNSKTPFKHSWPISLTVCLYGPPSVKSPWYPLGIIKESQRTRKVTEVTDSVTDSGTQQDRYSVTNKSHCGLRQKACSSDSTKLGFKTGKAEATSKNYCGDEVHAHVRNIYPCLTQNMCHVLLSSFPSLLPTVVYVIVLQ